jgi:hypothetical protein
MADKKIPSRDTITKMIGSDVTELVEPDGLIDQLEGLLTEQSTAPVTGTKSRHKVFGPPGPWNTAAAYVLMTIHQEARRLEMSLRRQVAGRDVEPRGGSTQNTRRALEALLKLGEAVDDHELYEVARTVSRLVTKARELPDIGLSDQWGPLPRVLGHLPPCCDYCGTFSLRWARRTGDVRCCNDRCEDENGRRPTARLEIGQLTGEASLVWRDGRSVVYQVEEGAA